MVSGEERGGRHAVSEVYPDDGESQQDEPPPPNIYEGDESQLRGRWISTPPITYASGTNPPITYTHGDEGQRRGCVCVCVCGVDTRVVRETKRRPRGPII